MRRLKRHQKIPGYEWHNPQPGPIFDWYYVWRGIKIYLPVWLTYLFLVLGEIWRIWRLQQ